MKQANRTCVVVAGMHRSGTSALTRVLNLIGCDLPQNLIGQDPNNETGYWEPTSINTLNDRLLASAGSSWDDCTPCTPGWFESPVAEDFKEQSIEALNFEFGASKLFVLKEPRICRLLPFWLEVIESQGIEPLIMLPIRNPLAVADSLAKRDLSDPFYNQFLWLRHVLDAEKGSRGKRRFFCGYDDLVDSWSTVISKSEAALSFKWPRLSPKSREEVDQYIASRHRHHTYPASSVLDDTSLSDWLRETYKIMLDWIASGEKEADFARLDAISSAFDGACTSFARVLYRGKQAQAESRQLRDYVAQRDQSLIEASQHAGGLETELNVVRQNLAETSHDRAVQAHRVGELEAALHSAQNEYAAAAHDRHMQNEQIIALNAALDGARQHQDNLDQQLSHARTLIQKHEEQILALTTALEDGRKHQESLAQQLGQARAQVQANEDQILTLNAALEDARQHQENLDQQLAHARAQFQTSEDQILALNAALDEGRQHQENLDQQLAHARAQVQANEDRILALSAALDDSRQHQDNLEQTLASAQAHIQANETQIATLSSEGTTKDETIITLQQSLEAMAGDLASMTSLRDKAVAESDQAQTDIASLMNSLSSLQEERDRLAQESQVLQVELASVQANLAQSISDTARLAAQAEALNQLVGKMEADLQALRLQGEEEAASLRSILGETSALLATQNEALKQLESELSNAISERDLQTHRANELTLALQASLAEAGEQVHALNERLEELGRAFNNVQQERLQRETVIEGLEEQLEQLRANLDAALAMSQAEKAQSEANILQLTAQSEAHVSALLGELAASQQALETVAQERDTNANIINGLKAHIQLLTGDLESAHAAQAAATAQLAQAEAAAQAQLQSLLDASEQSSIEANAEIAALSEALQAATQERDTNSNIINGLKAHIDLLMNDVEAAHKAHAKATAQLAQSEALAADTQSELEQLRADMKARLDELSEDLQSTQESRDSQEQMLGTLEGQIESLQEKLQTIAQEKDTQLQVITGLKAHIDLLLADVDAAGAEQAALLASLEAANAKAAADMAHAQAEHSATLAELETLQSQLANHAQARDEMGEAISALEAQVASANAALETAREAAQSAGHKATEDLAASQAQLQDLQVELNRYKAIAEGLKQHVHLLMADVDAQKAELEVERTNQAGLWRIIDQLQSDVAAAETREQSAAEAVKTLEHAVAHTESALRQRSAETSDLHKDLKAAQLTLESERQARARLETDKANLAATLNARLTTLTQDLETKERDLAHAKTALDRMQTTLVRQARDHQAAMADKEANTKAALAATAETTEKLRNQVNTLVRGLAEEKPAYFQRKSASIVRKAALLKAAGVIDEEWYLSVNEDVAKAGLDPAVHFLTAGISEGRAGAASQ